MAEDLLISEELRNKIGVESEPEEYEIEKGMIQRFAQAIDDSNPLWQDEEHARKSSYGAIIAPPTLMPIIGFEQSQHILASVSSEAVLHGGTELECYQPVRVGDTITVTNKPVDLRERQRGKMGKMVFMTLERTYKNQSQELVGKCRQTFISYKSEVKHD